MKNIKYLEINGTSLPYSFGLNQSIEYCKLRDVSITEMNKELASIEDSDGSIVRDFIFSALLDGHRREKKEVTFDSYDVGDWLEEMDTDTLAKVFDEYVNSLADKSTKKPKAQQKKK